MNYCSHCGATVTHKVPAGDNLPRHVCDQCERRERRVSKMQA
ncbi:MAG: zinc ribbon domain-containing protein [Nitrospira sp.]|nr:zinc ribbon domain-containing protein [Nitrospira sp.]